MKSQMNEDDIENFLMEVSILSEMSLDHNSIIDSIHFYQNNKRLELVQEICYGCEPRDVLAKQGVFSILEAQLVMKQLVSACLHMHKKGIVHRDLKLENILLKDNLVANLRKDKQFMDVKIIDFGTATHISNEK